MTDPVGCSGGLAQTPCAPANFSSSSSPSPAAPEPAQLWALFERQAMLYTGGDSCSIPVELAEDLWKGLLFCLSFQKAAEAPNPALDVSPMDLLRICQQAVQRELEKTKGLFRLARRGTPLADNAFFRSTLRSFPAYFRWYDIRFFAHALPAEIDYPLARPVPENLQGVCYAQEYLRQLLTEMRFLACFEPGMVRKLLTAWLPLWPDLSVNLCEPVFTASLGLALLGDDPHTLVLGAPQLDALSARLKPLRPAKLDKLLAAGTAALCNHLELWDETTRGYLSGLLPDLATRVRHAGKNGWPHLFTCLVSDIPASGDL